ncbi:MAG: DUF1622 domain-containing protein [Turicibacter sp.]|nr:DUF1622 domain-containing protein [Turicibacter sp.]
MLEQIVDETLPIIIKILEAMGIFIITLGGFRAFYQYIKTLILKDHYSVKHQFANSMATGLEFKLAAEILKTALIQNLNELLILGSIFLLRVLMTIVIEWEIKEDEKKKNNSR